MTRFLASLLLVLLAGCDREAPMDRQQAYVFGTLVEVTVPGAQAERAKPAITAVLARFDTLHRELHPWEDGTLTRINTALARAPHQATVSPQLAALLRETQQLAQQSDQLFDPAIGRLIALWGFHQDLPQARLPAPAALAAAQRDIPDMNDLVIDGNTLRSRNPALQLDLGGYAKGYALDEAVRLLRQHGVRDALVNIGGNVIALGRAGERAWRIGIQAPRGAGVLATLALHDGEAIGTSGDYQRYFESGGQRYCHLIDPRTGLPARGMQSVTVLVDGNGAGRRSDALSKPLFIAGPDALASWVRRLKLRHVLAVDAQGGIWITPALAARLNWQTPPTGLHRLPG
jgi:thiamine biosynthesis lipoprotein